MTAKPGGSRRSSKGTPDVNTHFFHVNNQVIETREVTDASAPESMQPKYQNVWSPRYIDSLILRDENTDADGDCDDRRVFYLADANYNVTALVAESTPGQADWAVRERYLYDPYGNVTVLEGDFSVDGVSDYANTTLYTGRELDLETRLYLLSTNRNVPCFAPIEMSHCCSGSHLP